MCFKVNCNKGDILSASKICCIYLFVQNDNVVFIQILWCISTAVIFIVSTKQNKTNSKWHLQFIYTDIFRWKKSMFLAKIFFEMSQNVWVVFVFLSTVCEHWLYCIWQVELTSILHPLCHDFEMECTLCQRQESRSKHYTDCYDVIW